MDRVIDIAEYIFQEYKKTSGKIIDEMKLHKLLYFCQRESLAITDTPMFQENFEGWKYGPVCREVRAVYTEDGIFAETHEISDENMYIAKNMLLEYGAFESWKLSEISHKEISWRNSRLGIQDGENGSKILSLTDIRKDAEKVRPYDHLWDMYYDEFEDVEDVL